MTKAWGGGGRGLQTWTHWNKCHFCCFYCRTNCSLMSLLKCVFSHVKLIIIFFYPHFPCWQWWILIVIIVITIFLFYILCCLFFFFFGVEKSLLWSGNYDLMFFFLFFFSNKFIGYVGGGGLFLLSICLLISFSPRPVTQSECNP